MFSNLANQSQAIAAQLKGRRMPMLDRVEIVIIEESQPRWLSFLNGQTDLMERLPNEFAPVAVPNDKLAPNLAKRGITMDRAPLVDITLAALFNQDNPVVGGYTPEKVALRRAIALAYDNGEELRALLEELPHERFVYVADSGHAPYGERDVAHVVDRSRRLAGWLRERVCQHMCPYGRFQGSLMDAHTLSVSYDARRGEPRGKGAGT